jgi:hypothetical protein
MEKTKEKRRRNPFDERSEDELTKAVGGCQLIRNSACGAKTIPADPRLRNLGPFFPVQLLSCWPGKNRRGSPPRPVLVLNFWGLFPRPSVPGVCQAQVYCSPFAVKE